MASNPILRITSQGGTVKGELDCTRIERTDPRGKMSRAQATVLRSDYNSISIDARTDTLEIDRPDGTAFFGGRFDDDQRAENTVTVKLVSFERDALNAEPTARNLQLLNTADATVINNYVAGPVGTLTAGTVDTLASDLSWNFPNSARSKVARKVQVATGGALKYNPDKTLDYVDRIGTDRTETISRGSELIATEPTVTIDSRDEVTHIIGYGSREGGVEATAIASSYSGGPPVYREFEDTDIQQESRLQTIIDRMVNEYDGEREKITVEAELYGLDEVKRGDTFKVELPRRNIDRRLEVIKVREVIDQTQKFVTTLTNRVVDGERNTNPKESLQRFNRGYQGFLDRDNFRAIERQPVSSSVNAIGNYFFPDDVVNEKNLEVVVQALPYRSYVSGAGHSHDVSVTHPSHDHDVTHPSHDHDISTTSSVVPNTERSVGDSNDGTDTFPTNTPKEVGSISVTNDGFPYIVSGAVAVDSGQSNNLQRAEINLRDSDGSAYQIAKSTASTDKEFTRATGNTVIYKGLNGQDVSLQIFVQTSDANDIDLNWNFTLWHVSPHGHDVSDTSTTALGTNETSTTALGTTETSTSETAVGFDPGLNEFSNETVSNVDLLVNGSTVASNIGSGEFTTTVDISGKLTTGNNSIELASDTLGFVTATIRSELFRSTAP